MKTLPLYWPNLLFKYLGTSLLGACFSLSTYSQSTTLPTPSSVEYPGILESFEKIIQFDNTKFSKKADLLLKNSKANVQLSKNTSIELDPDFLNSIILHSDPSYIKLASINKCGLYDTIVNDLLKNAEEKIKNIFITYTNQKQEKESAIISKKDFLDRVVNLECPNTPKLIDQFQLKNLDQTLKSTPFPRPTGREQCQSIHLDWQNNPKAPYLCKLHEFIKESNANSGDPKDLAQRQAITKILEKKLSLVQREYLENLCSHFDHEDQFCDEFLNISFWSKIANGTESKVYIEDICYKVFGTNSLNENQLKQCLAKAKKENDICLYPGGKNQGLLPSSQCDTLATALNYSSLRSDYKDCPGSSDQQTLINMSRILLNISKEKIPSTSGPCSTLSTATTFEFNKRFNNDEGHKLEACYNDELAEKEVCYKTYFGNFADGQESYTTVVANILRKTRGADSSLKCQMTDSEEYNPLLLQYRSGCYIIYERSKCFASECRHKIIYNDRPIDFVKIKNRIDLEYFPTSISNERFSQHYLLTKDYRQSAKKLESLNGIITFFKNNKNAILYGVGCAEDLLPSFFKSESFNQCTPLPFIIDGLIKNNDATVFVTRSALDSLQAPRLVSWSLVYSAVKSYQRIHPLGLWTLYGLD